MLYVISFVSYLSFPSSKIVVQTVIHAPRIDLTAVEIHADIVGRQVHRLIAQLTLAVQERVSALRHDHRVIGLVVNGCHKIFLRPNLRPSYTVLYAFGAVARCVGLFLMAVPVSVALPVSFRVPILRGRTRTGHESAEHTTASLRFLSGLYPLPPHRPRTEQHKQGNMYESGPHYRHACPYAHNTPK